MLHSKQISIFIFLRANSIMKNLVYIFGLIIGLYTDCYGQEIISVTNEQDLSENNLYGTYKSDGYYFHVLKSEAHLFQLEFEMHWYDDVADQRIVLDNCQGEVDVKEGKLVLLWSPCDNENSYEDIPISSNDSIDFEFREENNEVYLYFYGAYQSRKVD